MQTGMAVSIRAVLSLYYLSADLQSVWKPIPKSAILTRGSKSEVEHCCKVFIIVTARTSTAWLSQRIIARSLQSVTQQVTYEYLTIYSLLCTRCSDSHECLFMNDSCTVWRIRPLTHAPETSSRNWRHKFNGRFRCQFFCADARLLTSLTAFGARRQSIRQKSCIRTKNWHQNLASNLGLWHRFLEHVSGA